MRLNWSHLRQPGEIAKHIGALPNIVKTGIPMVQQKIRNVDLRGVYLAYDKLTGLDRVRLVHDEVVQAEKCFVDRQLERRAGQAECFRLEEARNRVNSQLDTINRSDEMFLKLITEVHELSRKHKEARTRLATIETAEQVAFDHFSAALRRSQAEERVQANRMRQWSIGLSVAAGLVGFGTTWLRFHKQHAVPSDDSGTELYASRLLAPTVSALQHTTEQLQKLIDPTISTLQNATEQLQKTLIQSSERPVFQAPTELDNWFPSLLAIGVMIGIGWLLFGRS
ncbi:Coiled-coil domain-containing protein 51 [Paragonimus westermani]|uniref:Coiled-coil domain-containing protein 51 n=1 Tax=Paragonimus westermani TaxID=34504 RepID=A0A8T0DXC7_9TREM|nr:Coiled-coil domain-containing protein 51 [Paragonimus westermani]